MINGYSGQILRVNLSKKTCAAETIDAVKARKFIGGAGYGAEILYSELKAGIDPLGPENKIIDRSRHHADRQTYTIGCDRGHCGLQGRSPGQSSHR